MNNKIVYVTKNEAQLIKADTVQNREIYFAEIEGAEIKAEEDYVRAMAGQKAQLLLAVITIRVLPMSISKYCRR